jgi:hypothetical protein
MPEGTWSSGVSYTIELVKTDVAERRLSVPGAAQAFAVELERQALGRDETEALLATLQFWARGVCK